MLRDASVIAQKDLRVEIRSRVAVTQTIPFAILVLLIFGFAFDQNPALRTQLGPGLFWLAVTFSAFLIIQRSFAIEKTESSKDLLRMSTLDPAGIFLGKSVAIACQLVAIEAVLVLGIVVLFGVSFHGVAALFVAGVLATVGLCASGSLYGLIASISQLTESLLPLLMLPILAPVVLGATQAWSAALNNHSGSAWRWCGLLAVFSVLYLAAGVLAYGSLIEEM